ncbi:MAG: hypothetical protein IIW01_05370 [Thermoguttaceae bacterium]|nr:hypothetical protein [Thermoguttaceae bacterium]
MTSKDNHRVIFAVPTETFQRLKAQAKGEGKTVRAVLLELVNGYLNADAVSELEALKRDFAALSRRVATLEARFERDDANEDQGETDA